MILQEPGETGKNPLKSYSRSCKILLTIIVHYTNIRIDHFTVVCSATWPVDGSEARVDLVLIQTSLLLSCKCTLLTSEQLVLHNKRSEVCIKTRSTLASLPSKGQVTKQTTVKWSILQRKYHMFKRNYKHDHSMGTWTCRNYLSVQTGNLGITAVV